MKELKEIPKQNPFRVPDNYFNDLSERIIAEVSAVEPVAEKKGSIRRLRPFLLAAASVAILAIIGYTAISIIGKNRNNISDNAGVITEYNISYLNDIDLATLEESVSKDESFIDLSGINTNEIIDYLIIDEVTILDIYEQF
jgi:hypothetical protein